MYKLRCGSIPMPRIYVAENEEDVIVAEENGLPYIIKNDLSDEEIIKLALLPTLEKIFPMIKWEKVLKISRYQSMNVFVPGRDVKAGDLDSEAKDSGTAAIATESRRFSGTDKTETHNIDLLEYVGDISSKVNIEQLQELYLLPKFLGEIEENITHNIYGNTVWNDGYNKKLKAVVGTYEQAYAKKDLVILDISGSIPRGVSSMMLTLIETLRERVKADLIITGSTSKWYPFGTKMPNPKRIRQEIGYSNETTEFMKILHDNVIGRKWGNVIVFGDNDMPMNINDYFRNDVDFSGTSVDHVWNYHTWSMETTCGYAKWIEELLGSSVPQDYNTDWCEFVESYYYE